MTPVACAADLAAALRAARRRLGLSQAELERGKPSVRFELVLRVIEALGGALELSWRCGCTASVWVCRPWLPAVTLSGGCRRKKRRSTSRPAGQAAAGSSS